MIRSLYYLKWRNPWATKIIWGWFCLKCMRPNRYLQCVLLLFRVQTLRYSPRSVVLKLYLLNLANLVTRVAVLLILRWSHDLVVWSRAHCRVQNESAICASTVDVCWLLPTWYMMLIWFNQQNISYTDGKGPVMRIYIHVMTSSSQWRCTNSKTNQVCIRWFYGSLCL